MTDQMSTIPKRWKMTTLGEVVDIQPGFAFKSQDFESKKGFPVVKIKNIQPPIIKIERDDLVDISSYGEEKLAKFEVKNGEFLIAMTGETIGKVGKYNLGKFAYINQRVCKIIKTEKSDYGFVYYLLLQRSFQKFIDTHSFGAAQANISTDQIGNYKILLPEPLEQHAIAAVLSSLDDKIGLLREQNKTLEATAQAIFKEWFVNFNFPEATGKMKGSELGEIPEGWRVGKLGDEFDITIGRTPPRLETEWFSDEPAGKKWISIKDIGNSEMYISNTSEYLTDEAIEKFNIPIIPENTAILSFKMTVGKLAITTEEMLSNEAIAHLKVKENSNFSTEFIYLFLKGLDFNSLGSTSSIVTAINSSMIKALEVLIPKDQIMLKFNSVIQPIFAKLKNNNFQIQTLSTLRDTLLPKLMKGELRVKNF